MGYGFWFLFVGKAGHTSTFDGPFDAFMNFFFFLPNLIVAELYLRNFQFQKPWIKAGALLVLTGALIFIWLATYQFTFKHWAEGLLMLVDLVVPKS